MEQKIQITVTNNGDHRRWYDGFDYITGEKMVGVQAISYPLVSTYQLQRLLLGTPEEIQDILSALSNI